MALMAMKLAYLLAMVQMDIVNKAAGDMIIAEWLPANSWHTTEIVRVPGDTLGAPGLR